MRAAVIVFPGSNCDRDLAIALEQSMGRPPALVWHADASLPDVDLIAVPGGFSFGDYLRSGAIAAQSPIMRDVVARAAKGTPVLGICNGFQVLVETGLLPGALLRNGSLKFVCRDVKLRVERTDTPYTGRYKAGDVVTYPVAHHDGHYFIDADGLKRLEDNNQVAFRYVEGTNPNGSIADIAGVFDASGRVLGLMPHPERLADPLLGGTDGRAMFDSLVERLS
jgi:phosphoribosylformylglycinamidine synthase subunit PurQ / glutaminase